MSNQIVISSYLRISVEDGDTNDSQSISGQRSLIMDYIRSQPDLKDAVCLEFCDDGYSGTNFNRPSVQQLLSKVKGGEIHCIIVKDFSRFGRNYIDVGDYLEQIFPFLRVRFISINDGYDSDKQAYAAGDISIAFKNLCNDYYCKDISRKIKSSLQTRRESGKFLSSYEVYGYEKSKEDKHKLVIDKNAAGVIRRIFDMVLAGKSSTEIALALNTDSVPTPAAYKKSKGVKCNWRTLNGNPIWTGPNVLRLIRDIRYTGAVAHGMYEVLSVGSDRSRMLPREQWHICYNQHEPIVSKEEYEQAQNCIKKRPQNGAKRVRKPQTETPLSQISIRCGCCGYTLNRHSRKGTEYYCRNGSFIADNGCFTGCINNAAIESTVLAAIQKLFAVYSSQQAVVQDVDGISPTALFAQIQRLHKDIERLNGTRVNLYKDYSDDRITREKYLTEREVINAQIENLTMQASELEQIYEQVQKNATETNPVAEAFGSINAVTHLTSRFVSALVDCVYVYSADRIEVKLKVAENAE